MIPRAFFWLSFLNLLMPGRTHQRNWSTNNQMNDSAGVISYDYYPNTTTTWEPIKIPRVFVSFSVVVAGAVYFKVTSYGVILPFDFSTQWAVFPSAAALILIVVFLSRPRLLLRVLLLVSHTLVYWADAVFLVHCTSTVVVLWESFRASLLFWSYMDRVS